MNEYPNSLWEATRVIAVLLKELYPQNPDIVLGREARHIVNALHEKGFTITKAERVDESIEG